MASLPAFPPPESGQNSATRIAAKITAVYALLAAFWIYFSDRLLLLFVQDIHQLDRMQTAKGWFFVLMTTLLFFYLSRQSLVREQSNQVALLQQKRLLKQVIDTIPVGIRLVDLKGEITFVNPASTSIRGEKRKMSIEEEDRSLSRALHLGEATLDDELLIEIPDGSLKTILESTVPLLNRSGNTTGAIVIDQDITKRKEFETGWRLSQFCIEQASIGIFRIDEEGDILNVNNYACTSLGYTYQELCTLSVFDIDPDLTREYWLVHRTEIRNKGAGTIETRHRRKDGSIFPVEVSISYLEYEGNPFSFSFAQDITERKQAEFELLHHKEHLEELVAERTAELKAANQDLKSFSYSVSHDLRAPLRAVSGFTHILTNRYRSALDEQGQHYLDNIETAAERMSKLIDDLLAYSRIRKRGVRLQPIPLDKILSVLIEERSEILTKEDLILTVAPDLPTVLGDQTLLRQALANLLDNALTYRRPGVAHSVAVDWEEIEDDNVIIVRDNGIGIAAEYQDKIFDVFQRLHSDDDFPGTGIGLSIVKKVADLLGGDIGVESVPGEGSSFNLRLRRAPDTPQQQSSKE